MNPAPDHVCEDLLLAILDELPSRVLVQSRSVSCVPSTAQRIDCKLTIASRSRFFAVLADEILRRRFLTITRDDSNVLIVRFRVVRYSRGTI